jgi:HEAT repeat protein
MKEEGTASNTLYPSVLPMKSSWEKRTMFPFEIDQTQEKSNLLIQAIQSERVTETLLNWEEEDKLQVIKRIVKRGLPTSPSFLQVLELLLDDPKPSVCAAAIHALGMVANPTQKMELLARDQDSSWQVRAARIQALGTLGKDAPIELLTQALLHDPDETVRETAVWALLRLGEDAPGSALLEACSDESELVRAAALEAIGNLEAFIPLAQLSVKLRQGLDDESDLVRAATIQVAGGLTSQDRLIHAFQDESEVVRASAIKVIGKQRKSVPIDIWIRALKDDGMVSQQASSILGKVKDLPSYVPTEFLLQLLSDEHAQVRALACWILGEKKALLGLAGLVKVLSGDEDSTVREAASWAVTSILSRYGPSLGQPLLCQAQFVTGASYPEWLLKGFQVVNLCDNLSLTKQPYTSIEHIITILINSMKKRRGFIAAESCQNHILLLTFCFQREEEPLLKRVFQDASAHLPLCPIQQALEDSTISAVVAQIMNNGKQRPNAGLVAFMVDIVWPDEKRASDVPTKLFLCFLECNHVRENDSVLSQDLPVVFWQDMRRAFDKRARNFVETLSSTLFQFAPARLWYNIPHPHRPLSLQGGASLKSHFRRREDDRISHRTGAQFLQGEVEMQY